MLIVNADDLGRSREETNATLACYSRGRVSSTSAMVFMADSTRAADLAADARIPTGLHLNLSERFTAPGVPAELRASHDRLCGFLRMNKYALIVYNPLLVRDFATAVSAQFDEFRRLYGRDPAHIDGHQHMHLATNVLWQGLLPAGVRVRRSFSFAKGKKSALNRWYRARVDAALARRHATVDFFYSLTSCLGDTSLSGVLAAARTSTVELMVHAAWPREFEFLMSDDFEPLRTCMSECTRASG